MRVVQKGPELHYNCSRCNSTIAMFAYEITKIERDYDDGDPAYSYWDCPVCKKKNVITIDKIEYYD